MDENNEKNNNKENEEIVAQESTDFGIEISPDVIAKIAGIAVLDVQGVSAMSGGFAGGISEVFSGKKNLTKGIKVDKTEDSTKIDVNIIVEYGSRIPEVAYEIQTRVKKAVENMAGVKVEKVNVHVQGVNTETNKNDKNEEEKTNTENVEENAGNLTATESKTEETASSEENAEKTENN